MMEIRLLIKAPDVWVRDIVKMGRHRLRFMDCVPHGTRGGRGLLQIEGDKSEVKEIIDMIESHPDIEKVEASTLKDGGVLLTVTTNRCHSCRALAASECFLISSTSTDDGDLLWTIIAPNDRAISNLVDQLEKDGTTVRFMSINPIDHKKILTGRQLEVLRMAYRRGYYNVPKGITIKQLAHGLDVSPSTVAEILQRGEKKIVGLFLDARR